MRRLLGRRLAKLRDAAALGIHRAEEVLDRPVLPGSIEPLQADEERPAPLHVEHLLKITEALAIVLDLTRRSFLALLAILEGGVDVGEVHSCSRPNPESLQ